MRKYLILLFCLLSVQLFADFSKMPQKVICVPALQNYLQKLVKIPAVEKLIEGIQREGIIKIEAKSSPVSKQFGAYWDPDNRVVCVDVSKNRTEGEIFGSLLFELHNASTNLRINELNRLASQKKISKDDYVKSMEFMEYLNSKNASRISAQGIKMGILPSDAYLPTYSNFEEHFQAQIESGHSACFARNYELCLR